MKSRSAGYKHKGCSSLNMAVWGKQMGVILPRFGDGATSQLGVREFISKYEEHEKHTPKGSALFVKVLVKEQSGTHV